MNVKISVKKLHRMEEMYKNRIKANRRTYRAEVLGWRTENEALKKKVAETFNVTHECKEKMAEADASLNRMDERIQAYQKEADEYKRDIEILSHQLNHTRQVSDNWSKRFVESSDKCKALELEVKELKKLFEEKVHSHLQQLAEINELKKDRKDWEDAARSAADNL